MQAHKKAKEQEDICDKERRDVLDYGEKRKGSDL